jgi:hypothetical protein
MTKSIPAITLLGASMLLLGACAPVPPPAACNACAAMDRANAAYALAQQAESDAQAARTATTTMYQRTLHK